MEVKEVLATAVNTDMSWGPYTDRTIRESFDLDWAGQIVPVTVTCPQQKLKEPGSETFPAVVMFNGFLCNSTWYRGLVNRVASWGFAVVQYDVGPLHVDRNELEVFGPLLDSLEKKASEAGSLFFTGVDTSRLAVMGHSRGGKLAVLHMIADTAGRIKTAVLLDPVDMSLPTKIWNDLYMLVHHTSLPQDQLPYPSAIKELKTKPINKPVAIVGAPVSTIIPDSEKYPAFCAVLPPGSREMVIPQAGHMQFTDLKDGVDRLISQLVGQGAAKDTVQVAAGFAVTWLKEAFGL